MDKKSKNFFKFLTSILLLVIIIIFFKYIIFKKYTSFTDLDNVPSALDIFNFNNK